MTRKSIRDEFKEFAETLEELRDEMDCLADTVDEEIDRLKEGDEWAWREIRQLSKEDNMDLPVPRLEIRYRPKPIEGRFGQSKVADYGLVYEHLMGHFVFCPLGSTTIGGARVMDEGHLDLPFRDGAHILNDMYNLKLPGFVVNGTHHRQLTLDDPNDLPSALLKKMKK